MTTVVPTWIDRAYTVLAYEQASLWHDLDHALRSAVDGVWSIEASNRARRVVQVARLVGPTEHGAVPWQLVAGGVYAAVLRAGGLEPVLPDEQEMVRLDELMTKHGGTAEDHRGRWSATVSRIQSETRWIRGEDE